MASAKSILDQILHRYTLHRDSPTSTKDKLHGAAFLVVDKSGPIYAGAAGHTSLPINASTPAFSTDSFLWVASLTKLLTTICLMQLVQQGKLHLDEDVREKLPELTKWGILRGFEEEEKKGEEQGKKAILEEITKPITARQLLTHSVGLSYDLGHPLLERWAKEVGKKGNTNSMTVEGWTTPLLFSPGEGWVYGTGLDWAGVLLERMTTTTTTTTLGRYMRENIFAPLGMECSTLKPATELLENPEKRIKDKLVRMALRDAKTGELSLGELPISTAWDPKAESGGAGLWTTAEEYGKVLAAVLRAASGSEEGERELGLTKETVDQMFSPQLNEKGLEMIKEMGRAFHAGIMPEFPEGFDAVDHGLGGLLNMEDVEGKRRKGSMMWHGYCNSHWWIDRETGIGACLLVEQFPFADPVVIQLYDDLERAVYGELVPEWKKITAAVV
ncbi:hypothetical protein NEUTE1DRAFT_85416 [Neurospora tetrasperma FGSC 2508]|uniref:Beta-lactamase-related domain-containing protein n=1 Tax=Neurospora tetrasperma (strain FGSC 2508 / ATCC MYA-4615 / P0657) TaxID=510951 RepID=F8MTC7_NEUT8|nr:uncharacterized protein NEUTE1DRAFT_85416 [Neurospora tetrasperma FGSC 2508]EGO55259.1 hypothetical protein NEUTE1DRAFT_85416 [Neurospora tetrasperma FGSC 2508]EGZ69522.1 beta-lactamase/transpeptidase-like protein [Neurospora tetrasperma FGSC 2509]